jgi:hypothetical protein
VPGSGRYDHVGCDRALRRDLKPVSVESADQVAPTDGLAHADSALADDPIVRPTLDIPTLFVCDGDDGGPRFHPCRRVQEALRGAEIEYEKVIAGHGSPIPFLRKGTRDELYDATGKAETADA